MNGLSRRQQIFMRLVPLDLGLALIIPPLFGYTLDVPDPWAATVAVGVLSILRVCITLPLIWRQLGGLDEWDRTEPSARTAELTRAAIASARSAAIRYAIGNSIGMASVMAVSTWYVMRDDTGGAGLGPRFIVAAILATVTIALGGAGVSLPLSTPVFEPHLEAVVAEGSARGFRLGAAGGWSLGTRITLLTLAITIAPLGWLGAIGYRAADTAAGEAAAVQARAAALEVAAGQERAAVSGSTRTAVLGEPGSDALPSEVVEWARGASRREASGERVDTRHDRAAAFLRAGDGRVLVSVASVSTAPTTRLLIAILIFFAAAVLVLPVSAFLFARGVARSIGRVTHGVSRLVEEGDLGAMEAIPILNDDEVGVLTRRFNQLVSTLRDLSGEAERVARGDLDGSIEGKGELPDAFRGMLEGLRTIVAQIRSTALQLAGSAAEIYSASQEQEAAATQQSSAITEASHTLESLAESAAHIAESASSVVADAERSRTTTEQMATRIAELNQHAGRIEELASLIRSVAERSDLLALNGSLEATRHGEQGRGFALVAGEMRQLSERVSNAADDVRTLVVDIRASGASSVMATDQSLKLAQSTAEAAQRISLVTRQQRSATEEVTSTVREVAQVIRQAATATGQTRASAEDLKAQADHLETLLARFGASDDAAAA